MLAIVHDLRDIGLLIFCVATSLSRQLDAGLLMRSLIVIEALIILEQRSSR